MLVPERDFEEEPSLLKDPVRFPTENSPSMKAKAGAAAKTDIAAVMIVRVADLIIECLLIVIFLDVIRFEIIAPVTVEISYKNTNFW